MLLLCISIAAYAQAPTVSQPTLWNRLYVDKSLPNGWHTGVLIEDGKYIDPWRSHIFLTEFHLKKKVASNWSVGLHGTYLRFALPHDPDFGETVRMDEMRWNQSITYKGLKMGAARMSLRLRAEERFFRTQRQEAGMTNFKYTFLRLRHRLLIKVPIHPRINWLISEEYMIQARKDLNFQFDQNRAGTSLMWKVNETLSLELGYQHWYQVTPAIKYSRHSPRTGLYIKL